MTSYSYDEWPREHAFGWSDDDIDDTDEPVMCSACGQAEPGGEAIAPYEDLCWNCARNAYEADQADLRYHQMKEDGLT